METTGIANDNPRDEEVAHPAAPHKPRRKSPPTQTISRPPLQTVADAKALVGKMEQMSGCFVGYSYLIELLLKVIIRNADELKLPMGADEPALLAALEKAIAKGAIEKIVPTSE